MHKLFNHFYNFFPNDSNIHLAKNLEYFISLCLKLGCSDIHFESHDKTMIVKIRYLGCLYKIFQCDTIEKNIFLTRLKVISKINPSNNLLPSDSYFYLDYINANLRLSLIPTISGEKIVLRIHQKNNFCNLQNLGMENFQLDLIKSLLNNKNGLIIIVGPTGSGKTSTLYACLESFKNSNLNIASVEDPVEKKIDHVSQININNNLGLTFPLALKALLRQDPDIILIGEIRDEETAKIAIQASQTGHLVLASVHCNFAYNVFARFQALNINKLDLCNNLKLVIAQRLIPIVNPKPNIKAIFEFIYLNEKLIETFIKLPYIYNDLSYYYKKLNLLIAGEKLINQGLIKKENLYAHLGIHYEK